MYHKEKSIQIKNSASALYNNLGVLRIAPRRLTYFTVVHANVVNMVSASWDGLNYSHRQLQSKEPNVATSTSLIMQVSVTLRASAQSQPMGQPSEKLLFGTVCPQLWQTFRVLFIQYIM